VKKIGNDTPANATPIAARSKTLPRRNAESTPIATPLVSHSTAAPAASDSVTGRRSSRSGSTGFWVMNEYPRQGAGQCTVVGPVLKSAPTTSWRRKRPYCT
jgi:hypothetical protein